MLQTSAIHEKKARLFAGHKAMNPGRPATEMELAHAILDLCGVTRTSEADRPLPLHVRVIFFVEMNGLTFNWDEVQNQVERNRAKMQISTPQNP